MHLWKNSKSTSLILIFFATFVFFGVKIACYDVSCWSQIDEFGPINVHYTAKLRNQANTILNLIRKLALWYLVYISYKKLFFNHYIWVLRLSGAAKLSPRGFCDNDPIIWRGSLFASALSREESRHYLESRCANKLNLSNNGGTDSRARGRGRVLKEWERCFFFLQNRQLGFNQFLFTAIVQYSCCCQGGQCRNCRARKLAGMDSFLLICRSVPIDKKEIVERFEMG